MIVTGVFKSLFFPNNVVLLAIRFCRPTSSHHAIAFETTKDRTTRKAKPARSDETGKAHEPQGIQVNTQ